MTGAGVALDAASRGYSVALVERDDWAIGTSSRSSKMVHGGLRYLQNFDLGLVREALLERQLMVQLAPHLVYPTPFLVPTLGEDAPRRQTRDRAQHVRRDGDDPGRPGAPRPRARAAEADDYWAPDRHRTIDGEEAIELVPALAPLRAVARLPLLRLPDRRRPPGADDPRRGRALRGRLPEPRRGDRLRDEGGRAAGVVCRDGESGEEFEIEADNVINATGVWADRIRPEEIHDEAEVPADRAQPRHPPDAARREARPRRMRPASCPPARSGTIFALPWYGRRADRDDRQRLRRRHRRVPQPGADDIDYLLERGQRLLRPRAWGRATSPAPTPASGR